MEQEKIGKCGLYCGACPFYCATKDPEVRKKLEKDWGKWDEDWYCQGCGDLDEKSWCHGCKFLSCLEEKELSHCAECKSDNCKEKQAFEDDNYAHHKTARINRERIKEVGLEAWYGEQEKLWTCPSCGAPFMWYSQTCLQCEEKVNGLKLPKKKEL